jgi:hypothetical protein
MPAMTDEEFRALRQLILDQGVKIEALALEVRALKRAFESTEIVYLCLEDVEVEQVDVPDDLKKFMPD